MSAFEGQEFYPLDLSKLPRGWAPALTGDVCVSIQSGFASGVHNSTGSGVIHVRPMNIDRKGRLDLSECKFVDPATDSRRLASGEVLFNNTNSPALIGKSGLVTLAGEGLAFSNHMTRLKPAVEINAALLAHQLHFLWGSGFFLHRCVNHVNQASLSGEMLGRSVPIAVPPAPEQRRIAESLDSYFTRLDAAEQALLRAQANLKRYRASVLKAAVEGRLVPTEAELARKEGREYEPASALLARILAERKLRWEKTERAKMKAKGIVPKDDRWKAKYEEPTAPDVSGLPELPEGWCWATVDQLIAIPLANGRSVQTAEKGFPVLRLTALASRLADLAEVKVGDWTAGQAEPFLIKEGDFLVARGSGSKRFVGRGALVVGRPTAIAFPDTVIRLRLAQGAANRELLSFFWDSRQVRCYIEQRAKTTAGIYKINQPDLEGLPIPLAPLPEQARLLSYLKLMESTENSSSKVIEYSLACLARLRQSILKWAFEGKLVDQDPNDEPAADLLARIRAAREKSEAQNARARRARHQPLAKSKSRAGSPR